MDNHLRRGYFVMDAEDNKNIYMIKWEDGVIVFSVVTFTNYITLCQENKL